MKFKIAALALWIGGALMIASCTLDDLFATSSKDGDPGLDDKVVRGLKTALEVGIDSSSQVASRVDGYLAHKVIKILLPEEAAQALQVAAQVGQWVEPISSELQAMQTIVSVTPGTDKSSFASNLTRSSSIIDEINSLGTLSDSLVKYMNRAAEYAAPRSGPIFKDAIFSMTIADGLSLLNSSDSTAATLYLQDRTFSPLITAYTPIVDSTLALVPLTKYWGDFRSAYNTVLADYKSLVDFQAAWNANLVVQNIPALQVDALAKIDNQPIKTESLGAWTTEKALTGLFYLVGGEERKIRRDPWTYITGLASDIADLLGEVFGEIMKMEK